MADPSRLMTYTTEKGESFKGTANHPIGWTKDGARIPRAIPVHPDVATMFDKHIRKGLVDVNYQREVFNTRRDEFVYNKLGAVFIHAIPADDVFHYSSPVQNIKEDSEEITTTVEPENQNLADLTAAIRKKGR
jgi:hypothetical protein|tara:strand:+ start:1372 stop:1770 length:399 start_codon:yes stop_codon:yes gene_type:complete